MDAPGTASRELAAMLERVEAALARDAVDEAGVAMEAAADLCRRNAADGVTVAADELQALRSLAERCRLALLRLGETLHADCLKEDNLRRGISCYQTTPAR